MSFDLSRVTFNSWNDFLGAVMLQGRPQLDSDWNDQQAEVLRRIQVGTLDAIGQAVYPAALPNSFQIAASSSGGDQITIGAGRMYVDGILAENHGPSAVSAQGDPIPTSSAAWDTSLAELSNSYPGAPYAAGAVPFAQQPYYPPLAAGVAPTPAFTPPTTPGPFLVYLDVWQRPVTYIEHPDIVEKAVGVDTTGRLQTVWQVKLMDVSANPTPVDCTTALADVEAWGPATAPSAGGLTTGVVQSSPSGPCCLTPNTGYTGMENQLYRVEIHAGGGFGTATFKWSKDNASVMTAVTVIAQVTNTRKVAASQLTVDSLGRDEVLGFNVGDWIEILDDYQDLNCESGCLHMIDSINIAAKTITLDSLVDTATVTFPVGAQNLTDPTRHTRIRRWDQKGLVLDVNGNTVANVGQAGGPGDIPITDSTTVIVLENGVTVQFNLNPTGGVFLPGDYWNFAARASDGSVEILAQAPPLGIHHHYTRLSVVTFPSTALDCRTPWPAPGSGGGGCGCTVIIGPGDVTATNTLQQVLDRFTNLMTETVICLSPGTYVLSQPLRLTAAHSNITLDACQQGTAVLQAQQGADGAFGDGMLVLEEADSFTLSGLAFLLPMAGFSGASFGGIPAASLYADIQAGLQQLQVSIGVRPINCDSLTIEGCQFAIEPTSADLGVAGKEPTSYRAATGYIDLRVKNPRSGPTQFGAAVFAGGSCSNLRMTDNQVNGGTMFAGFLLAPSVSLAPSKTYQPVHKVPNPFRGNVQLQAQTGLAQQEPVAGAGATRAMMVRAGSAMVQNPANEAPGNATQVTDAAQGVAFRAPQAGLLGMFNQESVLTNWVANGGSALASSLTNAVFKDNTFEDLTVAAMVLGEASAVQFTENELKGCKAGLWIVAPSMASMLLFDLQHTAVVGLAIAMGYPLPQGDTSTPAAISAAPTPLRFYTGAKSLTDKEGNAWYPDVSAPGVAISGDLNLNEPRESAEEKRLISEITAADPSETDPSLYVSERWGTFTYTISNLTEGFYQVTLRFMEIVYTDNTSNKGVRLFNVTINGNTVLDQFDIASDAPGAFVADDKVFSNVAPQNGQIVIAFVGDPMGTDHNAKVSAVEIEPQWDGSIPNPYIDVSGYASYYQGEMLDFYSQLAQLGQQAFARPGPSTLDLRVDANEMAGLTAPGILVLAEDQLQDAVVSSLMMGGNRVAATVSVPKGGYDDPNAYFLSAASVLLVTRCVVAGNMILNAGTGTTEDVGGHNVAEGRQIPLFPLSLVLEQSPGGAPTHMPAPLPKVSVSGNVFLGQPVIYPPRFAPSSGVPSPMNTWEFLNTTTL